MNGEKKSIEKQYKAEINKLKEDINGYEARLEAVLEDSSRKEKLVDSLLEESKVIKGINQALEVQVGSETGGGAIGKDGYVDRAGKSQSKKVKICWHWEAHGKCRFGEECYYDHPTANCTTHSKKSGQGRDETEGAEDSQAGEDADEDCSHWIEYGRCRYGDKQINRL